MDSAGTFNYVCDGTSPASAVLKDSAAVYTPGLSKRRSSTSKFLHPDALGTTRGITNSSQTATDGLLFDAFGMSVSRTGSTPTPFGFVGASQYQTDADSGLMLLGHWYYDCSIGRFITQDPAKDGDNWYAYCDNDPLGDTDPEGLEPNGGGPNKWITHVWRSWMTWMAYNTGQPHDDIWDERKNANTKPPYVRPGTPRPPAGGGKTPPPSPPKWPESPKGPKNNRWRTPQPGGRGRAGGRPYGSKFSGFRGFGGFEGFGSIGFTPEEPPDLGPIIRQWYERRYHNHLE